jgi:hypothetical protein
MNNVKSGLEGNNWLLEKLQADEPFCAGKIGGTECSVITQYIHNAGYTPEIAQQINFLCGVTPSNKENLDMFSSFYLQSLKHIDALGRWNNNSQEQSLANKYVDTYDHFEMSFLDPLKFSPDNKPWSHALEGKNILVVSPFLDSFFNQYNNRENWDTHNVCPTFKTFKVIRSTFSNSLDPINGHKNWIDAYKDLVSRINKSEFDVALVGCGAIGLPLCSYIKSRLGKQAIHTAGSTQLLFGVMGGRWETRDYVKKVHWNENWVYPLDEETPFNVNDIPKNHYGEATYFKGSN